MFYFPFIFFDLFFGTCQCRAQEGFRLFNQTQLLVFLTEGFSLLSDLYDECHRVAKQRDPPCDQKA